MNIQTSDPKGVGEWTPTPADIAKATAFHDGPFSIGRDPEHHAFHRAKNIRQASMFEMAKRLNAPTTGQVGQEMVDAL